MTSWTTLRFKAEGKRGWKYGRPKFVLQVSRGRGAGYVGGWTAFIAYNSDSLSWYRNFRASSRFTGKRQTLFTRLTRIEIGWTRNGNTIPYLSR